MANDSQEYLAYITHIRAEHKRLREYLHLIEQQWTLHHQRPPAADAASEVLNSLQALRAELAHHFEEEESGGCLEEAVSHQPSLSHEATRLEHKHPELLGQLDRLIERFRALSRPGGSTDKIKQEFRRFAEQLHDHEAAENRILEQSFGIEVE
jgi:iron-sulfur cluster repair protein YtfE (RIC family)